MVDGTPKTDIHREMKTRGTVSAEISGIAIASSQQVKQSKQVRRYLEPLDGGRGPTISM